MITFPKPPTPEQARAIELALDRCDGELIGSQRTRRDMWERMRKLGWVSQVGYSVTPAGGNAVGRPARGQAWGDWTVAWRTRRATSIVRALNWAGSWAEAVDMAASVGELLGDGYQVWYTSSLEGERRVQYMIDSGELDASYAEDHGNILVDSGARVRITDTGMLPAELLDREVENVVHAMRAATPGKTRTLAEYRAIAQRGKDELSAEEWGVWTTWAASADERFTASYLRQSWAAQEEPEKAARFAEADAARITLVRAVEAFEVEAEAGWGQPEGMLAAEAAPLAVGDQARGRDVTSQGWVDGTVVKILYPTGLGYFTETPNDRPAFERRYELSVASLVADAPAFSVLVECADHLAAFDPR